MRLQFIFIATENLSYHFTFLVLIQHFLFIFCFIESSESDGKKRRKGKGQEILEETKITSSFAKQLDLSCMKSSIRAPNINNGHIVKYNRWENLQHIKIFAFLHIHLDLQRNSSVLYGFSLSYNRARRIKKKNRTKNTQE